MRRFRLIPVLVFMLAAALPTRAGAVVGESAAAPDLAPHVVMVLKRNGARAGFCSGAVIARDVILTAAHCVAGAADTRAHYRDGQAVLLDVAAVATHPEFRPDAPRARARSVDLALLRLARPLPDRFSPARLAGAVGEQGAPLRLAGFGLRLRGEPQSGGALRSARLTVGAPASRLLVWARGADGKTGACTGDSGAPMFDSAGEIAAIAAWASGEAAGGCGALTQGAWIAPQRGWIAKILAGWDAR